MDTGGDKWVGTCQVLGHIFRAPGEIAPGSSRAGRGLGGRAGLPHSFHGETEP